MSCINYKFDEELYKRYRFLAATKKCGMGMEKHLRVEMELCENWDGERNVNCPLGKVITSEEMTDLLNMLPTDEYEELKNKSGTERIWAISQPKYNHLYNDISVVTNNRDGSIRCRGRVAYDLFDAEPDTYVLSNFPTQEKQKDILKINGVENIYDYANESGYANIVRVPMLDDIIKANMLEKNDYFYIENNRLYYHRGMCSSDLELVKHKIFFRDRDERDNYYEYYDFMGEGEPDPDYGRYEEIAKSPITGTLFRYKHMIRSGVLSCFEPRGLGTDATDVVTKTENVFILMNQMDKMYYTSIFDKDK